MFTPLTKEEGLEQVKVLVRKFGDNATDRTMLETPTRTDFINPLVEALGWDLTNNRGLPNREVIEEASTEDATDDGKPDYAFRAGIETKFFQEAKKISVNIKTHAKSALQARKYGFTDGHAIVVLTNFEYLIIYDTTIEPKENDVASDYILKIWKYTEFETCWDDIYSLLSREAVFSDSWNEKISDLVSNPIQAGASVNENQRKFLEQLNDWRVKIAKNLVRVNSRLDDQQINDLVQELINKILFLRIMEDRDIESQNQLKTAVQNFQEADVEDILTNAKQKYGSEIFDKPSLGFLKFDQNNQELKEVVEDLYWPKSPYSYGIIASSLLGSTYERFLTEEIHYDGSNISLVTKDTMRDIVPTPSFIIENIASYTVDERCGDLKPNEILELKVLDPATGSGGFLVSGFDNLIRVIVESYRHNGYNNNEIYEVAGGAYRLSLKEKIKVFSCLFGMDKDWNAMQITHLSLCLKLLENETNNTIDDVGHPILPCRNGKIECGNSVVDSGFSRYTWASTITQAEIKQIHIHDWSEEFDIILGNPPYSDTENMKSYIKHELRYFKEKYTTASGQFDESYVFIENGLNLLKNNGQLGFIIPNKFMKISAGKKLRELLSQNNYVKRIVDFRTLQVFPGKDTYTCLLFLEKEDD